MPQAAARQSRPRLRDTHMAPQLLLPGPLSRHNLLGRDEATATDSPPGAFRQEAQRERKGHTEKGRRQARAQGAPFPRGWPPRADQAAGGTSSGGGGAHSVSSVPWGMVLDHVKCWTQDMPNQPRAATLDKHTLSVCASRGHSCAD